ncbi:MAG: hypothetical protein AB8V45_00690 [Candidatus Midichloria sp.]
MIHVLVHGEKIHRLIISVRSSKEEYGFIGFEDISQEYRKKFAKKLFAERCHVCWIWQITFNCPMAVSIHTLQEAAELKVVCFSYFS